MGGNPSIEIKELNTIEECKALSFELICKENVVILGYLDKSGILHIPLLAQNIFMGESYKNACNRILSERDIDKGVSGWKFELNTAT